MFATDMLYLLLIVFLFVIELGYFKIADRYNIIDKPNHRSSHSEVTIRGGGVIFVFSVIVWFIISNFEYPLFFFGVLLIAFISFLDDLRDIPRRLRLIVHVIAIGLAFMQLNIFGTNPLYSLPILIFFIGVINAYNFMDGINGITGIYSLVTLLTLLWINKYQANFIDVNLIIIVLSGVVVFNFFNVRKKAACFAGDVGSITIAFIICFLIIKLIIFTSNKFYIFFLLVYGLDTFFTIVIRLFKRENIFKAHRTHLYQLLVNEAGNSHLSIAMIVNILVIFLLRSNAAISILYLIALLVIVYIVIRFLVQQKYITKNQKA